MDVMIFNSYSNQVYNMSLICTSIKSDSTTFEAHDVGESIYLSKNGYCFIIESSFESIRYSTDIDVWTKRLQQEVSLTTPTSTISTALSPIQIHGLDVLLKDKDRDFKITSLDSGVFPVHSALICKLWPFFETATSIEMSEKATRTLHLPYSKDLVTILVDFLYGKEIKTFDIDTATGLLKISAIYDIQELKSLVSAAISCYKGSVSLSQALVGWKAAYESGSESCQKFFSGTLTGRISQIKGHKAAEDYSEAQLLELYSQVAAFM